MTKTTTRIGIGPRSTTALTTRLRCWIHLDSQVRIHTNVGNVRNSQTAVTSVVAKTHSAVAKCWFINAQ